jgi:F-type H+-transporting ATPase subunit epsilon
MISTIRPGTLAVFEDGKVAQRYFLAGGFAEVTTERCTILAEGAIRLEDIDRAALEQELRDLREDVGVAGDETAVVSLQIAEAKLQALDSPTYAGAH